MTRSELDRHSEFDPFRSLYTQPMVSPVIHVGPCGQPVNHSGPGDWPYLTVADLHLLSSASFSWRTRLRVKFAVVMAGYQVGFFPQQLTNLCTTTNGQ
jgi:hypothetical protein